MFRNTIAVARGRRGPLGVAAGERAGGGAGRAGPAVPSMCPWWLALAAQVVGDRDAAPMWSRRRPAVCSATSADSIRLGVTAHGIGWPAYC